MKIKFSNGIHCKNKKNCLKSIKYTYISLNKMSLKKKEVNNAYKSKKSQSIK